MECPKCGCPNVLRERRPEGFTECRGCGYRARHDEWDREVLAPKPPAVEDLRRQLASAEAERDRLLNVRPEVRAFAVAMEAKLKANDHKGGWQDDPIEYFFNRLTEEMMELGSAICRDDGVRGEAVDVANFAMMIFDRAALEGDADG